MKRIDMPASSSSMLVGVHGVTLEDGSNLLQVPGPICRSAPVILLLNHKILVIDKLIGVTTTHLLLPCAQCSPLGGYQRERNSTAHVVEISGLEAFNGEELIC